MRLTLRDSLPFVSLRAVYHGQELDFALFIKTRRLSGHLPAQRFEDPWGDFRPEGEAVDDFICAEPR
jgi:hypothetical protein